MKRPELLSRFLIGLAVVASIGAPLVLWARTPLVHARIAENGGWSPDVIQAQVGKPIRLHFTSDDVVHGFAVGQKEMAPIDIEPGKVTAIEFTFERPGIYTFYCTRWCGLNHWRMRGTIEVSGSNAHSEPVSVPLYVTLGIDLDAPHDAPVVPESRPSALQGQQLAASSSISQLQSTDFYRANSPYQVFASLESESLNESEKWDVVSYIWRSNTTLQDLLNGQQLYTQNCVACHGERGAGDGVFADELAEVGGSSMQSMTDINDMGTQTPAVFTDAKRMLGASPTLLQGKILRGGMGTGMPMWGSIFTEEQIWDLVAYLYSFQFQYGERGEIP